MTSRSFEGHCWTASPETLTRPCRNQARRRPSAMTASESPRAASQALHPRYLPLGLDKLSLERGTPAFTHQYEHGTPSCRRCAPSSRQIAKSQDTDRARPRRVQRARRHASTLGVAPSTRTHDARLCRPRHNPRVRACPQASCELRNCRGDRCAGRRDAQLALS